MQWDLSSTELLEHKNLTLRKSCLQAGPVPTQGNSCYVHFLLLKHSLKAKSGSLCLHGWCTNMVYAEHLPFCWKLGLGTCWAEGDKQPQ